MARKNIVQYPIESSKSLAASFTSNPTVINYLDNIGYQIKITTTNSQGTFEIQASCDYKINQPGTQAENPGTWTTLTLGGGTPSVNAADDTIIIDINQCPFAALRVKYNSTVAGTGTCDITLFSKQLGG